MTLASLLALLEWPYPPYPPHDPISARANGRGSLGRESGLLHGLSLLFIYLSTLLFCIKPYNWREVSKPQRRS